jgi:hypothetical protein
MIGKKQTNTTFCKSDVYCQTASGDWKNEKSSTISLVCLQSTRPSHTTPTNPGGRISIRLDEENQPRLQVALAALTSDRVGADEITLLAAMFLAAPACGAIILPLHAGVVTYIFHRHKIYFPID